MTVYHTTALGPYDQVTRPPIGRLLAAIQARCGVGGTIRPGVRRLAEWIGYASAGHVTPLLAELAGDGWILYDADSGLITLLAAPGDPAEGTSDPAEGTSDPARDQLTDYVLETDQIQQVIPSRDRLREKRVIPPRDRAFGRYDAPTMGDPARDQLAVCMEDHDLTAAYTKLESVAVRYKLPCSAESIPPRDHLLANPAAQLMAKFGAHPAIVAEAFDRRPDWTPQQVAERYDYDARRVADSGGTKTIGIFFAALRAGQLAPPQSRGFDPSDYAEAEGFAMGGTAPPEDAAESVADRAGRLAPDASGQEWLYLQQQLCMHPDMTDDEAKAALAERRTRRPGGRP